MMLKDLLSLQPFISCSASALLHSRTQYGPHVQKHALAHTCIVSSLQLLVCDCHGWTSLSHATESVCMLGIATCSVTSNMLTDGKVIKRYPLTHIKCLPHMSPALLSELSAEMKVITFTKRC